MSLQIFKLVGCWNWSGRSGTYTSGRQKSSAKVYPQNAAKVRRIWMRKRMMV